MTGAGVGSRLGRAWARWYTRALPAQVAADRRDEIASDLWEQEAEARSGGRSAARHQLDVLRRVLAGVPADLSWRRAVKRSHPRPALERATPGRLAVVADKALVLLACTGLAVAASILPLLGTAEGGLVSAERAWVAVVMACGASLLTGLTFRLGHRRPVAATTLLVLGAPAPALAWFWLPPVYLLAAGIAVTALASRPRAAPAATGG